MPDQPTPAPWTVEQVRASANYLRAPNNYTGQYQWTQLAAMLDAYADLLAASAWRPIETAPKDGTRIMLFGPNIGCDIGGWEEAKPADVEGGVTVEDGMPEGFYGACGHWPDGDIPTHWMPLPPDARAAKE